MFPRAGLIAKTAIVSGLPAGTKSTQATIVPSMTKWEYVTVPLLTHATKQILDNWGDEGYELVAVVPGPNSEQLVAYMKRQKA